MTRSRKITVITPVYNGEKYLEETLQSIREQHDVDYEHIVVNDGSTDGSESIINRIATTYELGRFKYIKQSNTGEARAVNRAFLEASGEYVVVVNADDPLRPEALRKLTSALDANPKVCVAYPDWVMIDQDGFEISHITTKEFSVEALIGDLVCIPGPAAVVRRAVMPSNFDLREGNLRYISDYELWLRMSLIGPFMRVPEELATWRQHDESATSRGQGLPIALEILSVTESFRLRDDLPENIKRLTRQIKAMAKYQAALHKLHDKKVPGRRWALQSVIIVFKRQPKEIAYRRNLFLICAVLVHPIGQMIIKKLKGKRS